jgi:glycosyltransferase involved in cell wall biosynthesis
MLAALIMAKNEEVSIVPTLTSVVNFVDMVILYDTGSTDNTISVAKSICEEHNVAFQCGSGPFTNFAVTRNASIEFAEPHCMKAKIPFLVLLDAGDEFRTQLTKLGIDTMLKTIQPAFKFGIVSKQWLEISGLIDHYDARLIRVGAGCHYDPRYPVHETFAGKTMKNVIHLRDVFQLYQDRRKYGASSLKRYEKDREMLTAAPPSKRAYYFLGQTCVSLKDYESSHKYYKLALETPDDPDLALDTIDDASICNKILGSAIAIKKDHAYIFEWFQKNLELDTTSIDPYIMYVQYCIETRQFDEARNYLLTLSMFEKPTGNVRHTCNHVNYDLSRWHIIAVVALQTGDNYLGRRACLKAYETTQKKEYMDAYQKFTDRISADITLTTK